MPNLNQLAAIRKILADMPIEIIEDCYAEAERLAEKPIHDFRTALRKYQPSQYSAQACEYMEDSDVDYQQAEGERIFDALFYRVKVEWALGFLDNQNSTEDAA